MDVGFGDPTAMSNWIGLVGSRQDDVPMSRQESGNQKVHSFGYCDRHPKLPPCLGLLSHIHWCLLAMEVGDQSFLTTFGMWVLTDLACWSLPEDAGQ